MGNNSSVPHIPEPSKDTVFRQVVYRIPSLIYLGDNKILAFAERRRTTDDASTQALDMRTGTVKRNKGSNPEVTIEWLEPKSVQEAQLEGYRPMNPCPVYDKTSKTLFLFFICVKNGVSELDQIQKHMNETQLCYIKRTDDGQTWSEVTVFTEKEIPEIKQWDTMAVGPGHGIQMESGRLVVPLYAFYCKKRGSDPSFAHCLYSDDHGESWKLGNKLDIQSNECEVAEFFNDEDSIIYCNARKACCRAGALSKDGGKTFSPGSPIKKLVESKSGCQGSVVSFPVQPDQSEGQSGHNKWLLFSHPTKMCIRADLGVYLNKSPQDLTEWSKPWIINSGPSGYSDLAYIGGGWFVCLMECGEKTETEQIACQIFSYEDVEEGIEHSGCQGCCCLC